MRIANLELRKFGHFEDTQLAFGDGSGAGVHIVYGPNEAGKTTTLDAIRYTLHGMPQGRSAEPKYDFRFKTGQIRTAMELVLDSGETLAFERSRSTKASVHDFTTGAADEQLDQRLARTLAGVPRAVWDAKHGLDQDSMRRGAKALLENAATDESLFAAATGTASVHRVLEELRVARRALLSDAGSAGELHQAVKELKDATAELGKAKRAAAGYDDLVAEHRMLDAKVEELNAARHRTEQERDQLERALGAAAQLAQRGSLVQQLAAEGGVPAAWGAVEHEQLATTLRALGELDAQLATITTQRDQLATRLDQLVVDDTLIAAAGALDHLYQRFAGVAQASEQLPELKVEARRTRDGARAALEAVQPGCDDSTEPSSAVVGAAARTQLADAIETLDALVADVEAARSALEAARVAREAANGAAASAGVSDIDGDALDAAIEVASKIDCAALEADQTRLQGERDALEQRARRLGAKLTVDAVCELALPGERERADLETAFADLDERSTAAEEQLALAERHAAQATAELEELAASGTMPTPAELEALRASRDEAFVPLRQVVLGEAMPADAVDAIGTYETSVRIVDEYADQLADDGVRAGQARELQRRIDADAARATDARATLEHLAVERTALMDQWQALWAPTGLQVASVETMHAALGEITAIRAAADTLRASDGAITARRTNMGSACRDLRIALGVILDEDSAPTESLDTLLHRALTRRRQLQQDQQGAAKAQGELQAAERAVAEQQRNVEAAEAAHAAHQVVWSTALEAIGLDATTTPAAARAHLDALDALQDAVTAAAQAARLEAAAADLVDGFEADVRALIDTLGDQAGTARDATPSVAVEQLRARVQDAISDQKVHAEATATLAKLDEAAEQARATHAGSRATLDALLERAGVADRAALGEVDATWSRSEALRRQLQQLDHDLVRETRMPVEDLVELLGERSEAELRALLDTARETVDRLGVEYAQAKEARDATQKQVGALEEGDTQADAVARIRDARARLDQLVPEYRQLALQERMLQTMLDEHARRDMGPVVERTSRYLAQLTCGAWTRMVIGIGDDDRPQVQLERARRDAADDEPELVTLDGLSEGTVDQLYLALRLATLVESSGRGESMPLILDDVLPSFDDERATATFQLLAEVSEHFQIVFLTHHAHLAKLAEDTIEPGRVQLHPIPRFGIEPAADAATVVAS
ncbi:MAG: uncharacterized protein JWL76_457 [Thermoleophilia bacterium]|nr:uncharacterized protein [Thermoleophilia bacterium]